MRSYAFIDGQNLHRGIERQGWRLDYRRFRTYLRNKYGVKRAFYFIGYRSKFESLYRHLRASGYELVFKHVVQQQGVAKGNIDAELVLHATLEIPNYGSSTSPR